MKTSSASTSRIDPVCHSVRRRDVQGLIAAPFKQSSVHPRNRVKIDAGGNNDGEGAHLTCILTVSSLATATNCRKLLRAAKGSDQKLLKSAARAL